MSSVESHVEQSIEPDVMWAKEYIDESNKYSEFYKDDVEVIEIYFIYINENNEISHTLKTKHIIQDNKISRDELVFLVDKNRLRDFKYSMMLKYNFDIEPSDLLDNTRNNNDNNDDEQTNYSKYLHEMTYLEDIHWNRTISMMSDLNTLYILYNKKHRDEPGDKPKNKTRKNRIQLRLTEKYSPNSSTSSNSPNPRMKRKHKKTLRKRI